MFEIRKEIIIYKIVCYEIMDNECVINFIALLLLYKNITKVCTRIHNSRVYSQTKKTDQKGRLEAHLLSIVLFNIKLNVFFF